MREFAGVLIAAGVAFFVVLTELVTSKYPRTFFLVAPSLYLYLYGIIYALIAGAVYWLLPDVAASTVGVANPWARAFAVGLAVKALLHIRLFSVSTGPDKSFPVGMESIVQLFEPWLLTSIGLDEYNNRRAFLGARATRYSDVKVVRDRALKNVPDGFAEDERAAMRRDLEKAQSAEEVLSVYLRYTGRRTFNATFPA